MQLGSIVDRELVRSSPVDLVARLCWTEHPVKTIRGPVLFKVGAHRLVQSREGWHVKTG
jgi:hypothetical protein